MSNILIYLFRVCAIMLLIANVNANEQITPITYFGMHIHDAENVASWPTVKFGSWRLWDANVGWARLERQENKWDFTKLDNYVAKANAAKVEVLLPLGLTPTWASARPGELSHYENGNASEPIDINLWRNYVRKVAERYKGRITHYEIWNEVNDSKFYSGTSEMLVKLTCEARAVLKSVDVTNTLASPSVTEVGRELKWQENFLRLGGGSCVDAMSHHFYTNNDNPEGMVKKIHDVRQVLNRFGVSNLPLWNTETGWLINNADGTPTDSGFLNPSWKRFETGDSDWLVARALILGRGEQLDRFYWYSWDHKSMGLIEPRTKKLKPGAKAFGKVVEWLKGTEVLPCVEAVGVWSCDIWKNGKLLGVIAWSSESNQMFRWPFAKANISEESLSGSKVLMVVQTSEVINVDKRPKFFKILSK